MKNEIVKIETTQLETVVNESGLAIQEGDEIKKSYLPFLSQLAEVQSQATKINFDSPAEIDETIARELRLKTVKIRTGSKELKDERKKGYLLRGNLEQAAYNLIEASCKLTEDVFVNVEKASEFAEKKRKEQLRIERSEKLIEFLPAESMYLYALAEMSEEQFDATFDGLKMAHEKKIEDEKKAEGKRLAEIEAERVKNEQIRLENGKLKADAVIKDKRNAELRPYIIFIRDYNKMISLPENEYQKELSDIKRGVKEQIEFEKAEADKARKAQKAKERLAEIERKKQAQILADQKAKADKERAELLAKNQVNIEKAEKERKEKEQLLADIEAEKQAKLKTIEAEKKAKAAQEKKAKLAPDKTKLLNFGQLLNDVPRPEIISIEAAAVMVQINGYLAKLDKYIVDECGKL